MHCPGILEFKSIRVHLLKEFISSLQADYKSLLDIRDVHLYYLQLNKNDMQGVNDQVSKPKMEIEQKKFLIMYIRVRKCSEIYRMFI